MHQKVWPLLCSTPGKVTTHSSFSQKLTMVEKIGDYIFKLEFNKEEEKERVLDGVRGSIRVTH
jgi:hypothetical protein